MDGLFQEAEKLTCLDGANGLQQTINIFKGIFFARCYLPLLWNPSLCFWCPSDATLTDIVRKGHANR